MPRAPAPVDFQFTRRTIAGMECPCGTGLALEACCGPHLDGKTAPSTAVALMRSRYTAYVLERIDYIIATHHPSGRTELDADATRDWAAEAEWLGLEILDVQAGGEHDSQGEVEFVARYEVDGDVREHRERSTFRRSDGRWCFVEGRRTTATPMKRERPKVGRNEPCPCGSRKKYKRCCGSTART